jgi:YidC/Oxa1 family membrane protein insertase
MLLPLANILQPLIDFSDAILKFWHNQLGLGWGASIIGLTCTIRLLILPLTFKQVRSMQDLQRLQPEIKRLQERYKDDKQRMNQEMMKFYQEHKVNPLGSCLPLILQLPFFLSLYQLLRSTEFKHEIASDPSFLFIPNLGKPATGGVLITLIVLYIGTQLAASSVTAFSADKNQRRIMFALPFFFTFFIINFAAGLIVYWITTNLWTFGQQLAVKKLFPKPPPIEPKADVEPGGARGKPATAPPAGATAAVEEPGGGGFMGRIRAAMEQAQAGARDGGGAGSKTATKPPPKGSNGASKDKPKSGNGGAPRSSAPPPSPRKKKKRNRRR